MFLVMQRVRSASGNDGINAFHYQHGPASWTDTAPADVPEPNRGSLVSQSVVVPPPGNRVRSYLDIAAPDDAPWEEIHRAFVRFLVAHGPAPLPWSGIQARCKFQVGLEQALAPRWRTELAALLHAGQALVLRDRSRPSGRAPS